MAQRARNFQDPARCKDLDSLRVNLEQWWLEGRTALEHQQIRLSEQTLMECLEKFVPSTLAGRLYDRRMAAEFTTFDQAYQYARNYAFNEHGVKQRARVAQEGAATPGARGPVPMDLGVVER